MDPGKFLEWLRATDAAGLKGASKGTVKGTGEEIPRQALDNDSVGLWDATSGGGIPFPAAEPSSVKGDGFSSFAEMLSDWANVTQQL